VKVAEAMEQMHPNSQLYCEIELVSKEDGEGLPVVVLLLVIMVIRQGASLVKVLSEEI